MKNYFYTDGTDNFGPFSLEELKEKDISKETLICVQEVGEWKAAGTVPELKDIFISSSYLIDKHNLSYNNMENISNKRPPKTWLLESILVTLFCCMPFGIVGIVNASKVESLFYSGNIERANRASAQAKKWVNLAVVVGIVAGTIYIIALALAGSI